MAKETIIRDPIHGFISLSYYDFIKPLVETSYFQRLRRLAQLGVSAYVYPSATHNRLNHSLGAMELFVRLFDQLFKDSLHDDEIKNMRKLGVASALLHDTGHGPFSHTTEGVFEFEHEDYSELIISQPEIQDILRKEGIDYKDVIKVISNKSTERRVVISQLISSELDVDRLDYLTRDSYFTGAAFGNIDLERIIRTMTIYHVNGPLKDHAITKYKGKYSLESYILSRHLMYQGVYFHKATRCVEKLLGAVLSRAKELAQNKKGWKLPEELAFLENNQQMTIEQHQTLDDHVLYAILTRWTKDEDSIISDLSRRILNRQLFKAIEMKEKDFITEFHPKEKEIRELLSKNNINDAYYCLLDNAIEKPYKPYKPLQPDEGGKSVKTNIFVLKEDGNPEEISEESEVVRALKEHEYRLRLYVPDKFRGQVAKILGKDQIEAGE